jgi:rubrerythrin
MSKKIFVLNFMHCMERFATQIYLTQRGAFSDKQVIQQLIEASANEREHVQKLRTQIKKLIGRVYPCGWLFQFMGVIVGLITRLAGKYNLFRADIFVEKRAVKDYNGFLKARYVDADTDKLLRNIIAEEEVHILNWKKAAESLTKQAK